MPELAPVEPTWDYLVFAVRSATNPKVQYRVDLVAEGGYARCACMDWSTRRWPAIKAKMPIGTNATCCRHVKQARNFFLNSLLIDMAKREANPPQ